MARNIQSVGQVTLIIVVKNIRMVGSEEKIRFCWKTTYSVYPAITRVIIYHKVNTTIWDNKDIARFVPKPIPVPSHCASPSRWNHQRLRYRWWRLSRYYLRCCWLWYHLSCVWIFFNAWCTFANSINATKLFRLFVKKRVVTINGEIGSTFYNSIRVWIDGISVYQSSEFLNF